MGARARATASGSTPPVASRGITPVVGHVAGFGGGSAVRTVSIGEPLSIAALSLDDDFSLVGAFSLVAALSLAGDAFSAADDFSLVAVFPFGETVAFVATVPLGFAALPLAVEVVPFVAVVPLLDVFSVRLRSFPTAVAVVAESSTGVDSVSGRTPRAHAPAMMIRSSGIRA
jgi:hypothetical protein